MYLMVGLIVFMNVIKEVIQFANNLMVLLLLFTVSYFLSKVLKNHDGRNINFEIF